jgi:nucleotide-binding universal stress UspA family protein
MISSIVVGTDGSDTASEAVRQAGELARTFGARLHIVSAHAPVAVRVSSGRTPEAGEWNVNPDVIAEEVLTRAAGSLGEGIKVEMHARRGDPAEALIQVAEDERADILVVGNKGMSSARRFVLGNVPNKVSHHAPCSVLIIRTT